MSDHPLDVWVDVTAFGDAVPNHILAVDGREAEIDMIKSLYVYDRLTVHDLEQRLVDVLAGSG